MKRTMILGAHWLLTVSACAAGAVDSQEVEAHPTQLALASAPGQNINISGRIFTNIEDVSTSITCDPEVNGTVEVNVDGREPKWAELTLGSESCGDTKPTLSVKVRAISDFEVEITGRTVITLKDCVSSTWGCEYPMIGEPFTSVTVETGEEAPIDIPSSSGTLNLRPYSIQFNNFTARNLP